MKIAISKTELSISLLTIAISKATIESLVLKLSIFKTTIASLLTTIASVEAEALVAGLFFGKRAVRSGTASEDLRAFGFAKFLSRFPKPLKSELINFVRRYPA